MARIRTIKPEFWEDEKIALLPMPCRLFFIGCWNYADDFGVIKGNAVLLKSQIFPYDETLRVSELKKWIDALVDARFLVPISHKGESYYFIRTFRTHQILDKRFEKSYIGKEITNDLINNALGDYDVVTTCSRSSHDVGRGNGRGIGRGKEELGGTGEIAADDVPVVLSKNPEDLISDDSIKPDPKEKSCAKKENPAFEKFRKWIAENAPNVGRIKEPFSEEEFMKLKQDFSLDQIQNTLLAMHNWKPLLTRNVNANLTFRRWAAKNQNEKNYGKTIKPPPPSDAELMQAVAEGLSRSRTRQEWEL